MDDALNPAKGMRTVSPFEQEVMLLATDLLDENITFDQFLKALKEIFTHHGWKAPQ